MIKMNSRKKGLIKYILLQIPSLLLIIIILILFHDWIGIPDWLIWVIIILWISKDVILYPKIKKAYIGEEKQAMDSLIGHMGIAQEDINPTGYIRIGNELWKAIAESKHKKIKKGNSVLVVSVKGLSLIVKPVVKQK